MNPAIRMTTRDGCPYCISARNWFAQRGLSVQETVINDGADRQVFYDLMGLSGSARTVPQIFIDDRRIGGYTDLLRSDFAASR